VPAKLTPKVQVPTGGHLRRAEAAGGLHVLDIREALGAQERLGHVKRCEADGGRECQADRGGFRRPLGGKRSSCAKDAGGRSQRRAGQKIAAILSDTHQSPLY
jgi:hypothetical protein